MKRCFRTMVSVIAILLACAASVQAADSVEAAGFHGGWGHYHFHGGGWGWGLGLFYPYYAYPYYRYYDRPPVIIQQHPSELYVQPVPPKDSPQQQLEQNYWYYCAEPKGYYPYVKECPGGWIKVVPFPPPQQK